MPNVCGVYIVKTATQILYVGSSWRIGKRMRHHEKHRVFEELGATQIEWYEFAEDELVKKERQFCVELLPLLNSFASRTNKKRSPVERPPIALMEDEDGAPFPSLEDIQAAFKQYLLGKPVNKTLEQMAKEINVSVSWLKAFRSGTIPEPGYERIRKLVEILAPFLIK